MEIKEAIQKYASNILKIHQLDEGLYDTKNKDKWLLAIINRAKELSVIYEENNEILKGIKEKKLSKEELDIAFSGVETMYQKNLDDVEFMAPILYQILDTLKEDTIKNLEKKIHIYIMLSYEIAEYQFRSSGSAKPDSYWYYQVLNLKDRYKEFSSRIRLSILYNYYNVISQLADNVDTAKEAFLIYLDFEGFYKEMNISSDEEDIRNLADDVFMSIYILDDVIEDVDEDLKESFYHLVDEKYTLEIQNGKEVYELDSQLYLAYLHISAIYGKISYMDAIERYLDYFFKNIEENMDDFYYVVNTPISILALLEHIDYSLAKDIVKKLREIILKAWDNAIKKKQETSFINESLALWCIKSLKYLDSKEEKEERLFSLIIKRQLPTFIHSYMVMMLSEAIFETSYSINPSLFDSLDMEYEEIKSFIHSAALFHDIGKSRICDIVKMTQRSLSDFEFNGIKNHPSFGVEMISKDPDLLKYRDIILGHHKWYNGMGGYPMGYDNTKSKYRILTDIVTISDCMDAATDYLGRNYQKAKTLDMVILEFIKDKGIRYNPDIVSIIETNASLREKLLEITEGNRENLMYMACKEMTA